MALKLVLDGVSRVSVYDLRAEALRGFADYARGLELKVKVCSSPREAVEGADIIVTTTPSREPIVMNDWVPSGVHFNCIGADAPGKEEVDPAILLRAKVVVDDVEQSVHCGEINVPVKKGLFDPKNIYRELGEIVAGIKRGRESDDEITVFTSTGLAIQDAVTAKLAYEKALARGAGRRFRFVV